MLETECRPVWLENSEEIWRERKRESFIKEQESEWTGNFAQ